MSDKMDKEISDLLLKNAFEEYENARCDEIIEKYKDTEPDYSEEHKRRMEKLFKKEKHAFSWKKGLVRAAMVILAVFICGSMALQVEAFRIQIENWYYEITGEAIHIGNSVEDLPGYSETDMPIYVLSDEFVEKYGYSMTQEINEFVITSEYKNLNDTYIIIKQYNQERNIHIDNEDAKTEKQIVGEKEVLFICGEDEMTLCWGENKITFYCFTNIEKSFIQEMLESIVIKP